MIIFVLAFLSFPYSYASGFCQNADAIEEATKSVLMLYVYDSQDQLIATGSGFCAINNNTLITNFHVIEDGRRVVAASDEGETYSINKLFCVDKNMDIAILGFENPTGLYVNQLNYEAAIKYYSKAETYSDAKSKLIKHNTLKVQIYICCVKRQTMERHIICI